MRNRSPTSAGAVPCALPDRTALDRGLVAHASYADAYRIPLAHGEAQVVDIFFAVFGHHPAWLKAALLVRHRVGAWCGLDAASTPEIWNPTQRAAYRVGENIGPWPLFFLGESELVAGRD